MSINIRDYVSDDHVESIGEIARSQSAIIQALSIDNSNLEKEIERLNNELEVSRTNEETYRLEMKDITKRLGFDEDTLFDEVKDKAERLNNIIKGLDNTIENLEEIVEHKDSIINKAIKYLEEHTDKLKTNYIPKIDFNYKDLSNILKEVDKE